MLGRTCNRCIELTKGAKSLDLSVVIGVHHLAALTSMIPKVEHAENDTTHDIII